MNNSVNFTEMGWVNKTETKHVYVYKNANEQTVLQH